MNVLKRRHLLGLGVAAAIAMTAPLSARASESGGIAGRVVDERGAPVRDARVVVSSALLPDGEAPLASDGDGAFGLDALDAGFYDVSVELDGPRRGQYRDVQVGAGKTTRIEITLEPRVSGEGSY